MTTNRELTPRERRSTRLRYTERISDLCGFEYDTHKKKYGGSFEVYQLERIVETIEALQREVKGGDGHGR